MLVRLHTDTHIISKIYVTQFKWSWQDINSLQQDVSKTDSKTDKHIQSKQNLHPMQYMYIYVLHLFGKNPILIFQVLSATIYNVGNKSIQSNSS